MVQVEKTLDPGTRVTFNPDREIVNVLYDVDRDAFYLAIPALCDTLKRPLELTYSGISLLNTVENCINVPTAVFKSFYPNRETNWGDQFSLTIENYAYTDRVLEELALLGYGAVSPYQQCSTEQDPELARERWQTLIICLAAMIVILLLQVLVLRAMFGMQTENYRILSNIGLDCKTAKRSVFWQTLLFMILGQGLAAVCIYECGHQHSD